MRGEKGGSNEDGLTRRSTPSFTAVTKSHLFFQRESPSNLSSTLIWGTNFHSTLPSRVPHCQFHLLLARWAYLLSHVLVNTVLAARENEYVLNLQIGRYERHYSHCVAGNSEQCSIAIILYLNHPSDLILCLFLTRCMRFLTFGSEIFAVVVLFTHLSYGAQTWLKINNLNGPYGRRMRTYSLGISMMWDIPFLGCFSTLPDKRMKTKCSFKSLL